MNELQITSQSTGVEHTNMCVRLRTLSLVSHAQVLFSKWLKITSQFRERSTRLEIGAHVVVCKSRVEACVEASVESGAHLVMCRRMCRVVCALMRKEGSTRLDNGAHD